MQTPLVSIIIPAFNRAHLIGETLDSIIAQSYTNWECIVIDDGSTDNTDELLAEYCKKDARFQYHDRPKDRPKGGNAARNYGFELSRGEYIQWFDSDDIMLQNFIKVKIEAFEVGIAMVICTGYYVDEKLNNKNKQDLIMNTNLYKDYVLWKLKVFTPSILFKKEILNNNALFSTKLLRGQEAEFFSRLFFSTTESSYKIINEPLFLYRQHSNSKTIQNKKYIEEFKNSEYVFYSQNFKRALIINDSELVNFCYKKILNLFFRGIDNNHFSLSIKTLKLLVVKLMFSNRISMINFSLIGFFLIVLKRGSYSFEKKMMKIKIHV